MKRIKADGLSKILLELLQNGLKQDDLLFCSECRGSEEELSIQAYPDKSLRTIHHAGLPNTKVTIINLNLHVKSLNLKLLLDLNRLK
jgi:hypothetical protein